MQPTTPPTTQDMLAILPLLLLGIQLGGQYVLPAASLLRALWYGWQGRFPEGAWQIAGASALAGITALSDPAQVVGQDVLTIILRQVLGNAVFTAGLMAFIVTYLFRQTQNMSRWVDGIVGGFAGLVVWFVWSYILLEWSKEWWMALLAIGAGVAALIALRALMFVINLAVKIARWMMGAAVVLMIGAALASGAYLLISVYPTISQFFGTPTPPF